MTNPPYCCAVYALPQLRALAAAIAHIAEHAGATPMQQPAGIGQVQVRVDASSSESV